ncbi:hypothetical protein DWZ11_01155 [Megamonas rupellensis]|uniref:Uncharacterized protein n=1 Tax=Megamonas rupellensis TaxID=491921 RepID=A0A412A076_9FIRM|nr:phage terminase large subunit family protein [Megamonas rupellensis]RGQ08496.1 hypothetical protein DWZ11_01155 [Megamonas rupellensis]
MSVCDYNSLKQHIGHNIVCVSYGKDRNVSLECEDCNEILLSYDKEEKKDFLVICPECQEMFDIEEWNLSTFNNNYDENYNALALDENGDLMPGLENEYYICPNCGESIKGSRLE